MLLLALALVNLPWLHEAWTDHRIATAGVPVAARVLDAHAVGDRYFVDYRLPPGRDPGHQRFAARVDASTYRHAVATRLLRVRVVPGQPALNRPVGEVGTGLFVVIAVVGDVLLAAVIALLWWRRRRWVRRIVRVEGDLVTFSVGDHELTAAASRSWADRRTPGEVLRAPVHVEAVGDLLPALPLGELAQREGATWLLRGRVVDVDRQRVVLRLDDGLTLTVLPGPFRNRADLREYAEVTGRLVIAAD